MKAFEAVTRTFRSHLARGRIAWSVSPPAM